MTDQTLTFRVTAEAAQAQAELAKTSLALKEMGASASAAMAEAALGEKAMLGELAAGAEEAAAGFASFMSGGIIAAGFAELGNLFGETLHGIADIGREADRVGVSVENFQALAFGMREAGVTTEEFSTGLDRFAKNIGEASLGATKFGALLKANGIDIKDAGGNVRDTTSLLKDFADLIQSMPDQATRMAMITEAFGRGSAAMSLALAGGSAGIDEMIKKAAEFGVVLSKEGVAQAKELDLEFDLVTTQIGTFMKGALIQIGLLVQGVVEDLDVAVKAIAALGQVKPTIGNDIKGLSVADAQAAMDGLTARAQNTAIAMSYLANTLEGFGQTDAAKKMQDLADAMAKLVDGWRKGTVSADEFIRTEAGLAGQASVLEDKTKAAVTQLGQIDLVNFDGVSAGLGGILGTLISITTQAGKAAASVNSLQHPVSHPSGMIQYSESLQAYAQAHANDLPVTEGGGVKITPPGGGGGASAAASDTVTGLATQAQQAMSDLNLAIAVINEKVRDGLMSTADAVTAISSAKDKTNNDLAAIIAKVGLLGPAGQAAADQLRSHLLTATDALKGPIDDLAKTMAQGFASPFSDFIKGAIDGRSAVQQFGDSLVQMMIDVAAKEAETKVLEPMFTSLMGGTGDLGKMLADAFGAVPGQAAGGAVTGPGSGTSDSILRWLSNGEFVVNAAATAQHRGLLEALNSGQPGAALAVPAWVPPPLIPHQAMSPIMALGERMSRPQAGPGAAAASNHTVNIQPPAGHEAVVTEHGSGLDTITEVIFQAVDNRLAANLRAGRGAHVAALADTFGLKRTPR